MGFDRRPLHFAYRTRAPRWSETCRISKQGNVGEYAAVGLGCWLATCGGRSTFSTASCLLIVQLRSIEIPGLCNRVEPDLTPLALS